MKSPLDFPSGSRAQAVLTDLAFSAFLFILLFAFIYSHIQSGISSASSEQNFTELSLAASEASEALVSSKGSPSNWFLLSENDINSVGLARKSLVVDDRKLQRFLSLDYGFARQKLNMSSFEFYFRLYNSSGVDLNFGIAPSPASVHSAVSLSRVVDYKGVESVVEFTAFSLE